MHVHLVLRLQRHRRGGAVHAVAAHAARPTAVLPPGLVHLCACVGRHGGGAASTPLCILFVEGRSDTYPQHGDSCGYLRVIYVCSMHHTRVLWFVWVRAAGAKASQAAAESQSG